AAVQAAVEEVADQLRAHVEAHPRLGRIERLDREPENPVERDAILEDVAQRLLEAALVLGRARRKRLAGRRQHRPLNTGARRSRKAATPSTKSSVRPAWVCSVASSSSCEGRSRPKMSFSACLTSAQARVGWAASRAAS